MYCDLRYASTRSDGICVLKCNNCGGIALVPISHKESGVRRRCNSPEVRAERERQRKEQEAEALEAGEKLGWKPEHAIRWAAALLKWKRAGYPERTQAEVDAAVAVCEACEKYDAEQQRCKVCGCKVNTKGMSAFNKARMKTEVCPLDKWR